MELFQIDATERSLMANSEEPLNEFGLILCQNNPGEKLFLLSLFFVFLFQNDLTKMSPSTIWRNVWNKQYLMNNQMDSDQTCQIDTFN